MNISMATIKISDLEIATIIGTNDWERTTKQKVLINAELVYNASPAIQSDKLSDAVDYKALTKQIIESVENSQFYLLERLAAMVLSIIIDNPLIQKARVIVNKPDALRFARSVSVELSKSKNE